MLLAAGVGTASFWEYRVKPAGHSLLYLYYGGIGSTALYVWFCVGVWLMLGSRLSEGWWSRLTLYLQQLWGMALMGVCEQQQRTDYKFWWVRQESEALLWWCRLLQNVNTALLFAVSVLLLLLGASDKFQRHYSRPAHHQGPLHNDNADWTEVIFAKNQFNLA